jgi:hypothetical protein
MKFHPVIAVVCGMLGLFAGQALPQQGERPRPIDRVCIGRMLIVQSMDHVKRSGKTEQEYRDENPLDPRWEPGVKEEVSAVIAYVWSHSHEENIEFSSSVMQACYAQNPQS